MVVEHVLVLESAHEAKGEVVSAIDGLVEHGVDATTKIELQIAIVVNHLCRDG
jgi:hypothetical protein